MVVPGASQEPRLAIRIWQASAAAGMVVFCSSAHSLTPADASYEQGNTKVGDVLQYALPLLGLGLTFALEPQTTESGANVDNAGGGLLGWNQMNGSARHDFLLAFGRMEVFTYALKYTVPENRPNGGAHSFPSGHTASAFMGAEFIRKEYGWWWGGPSLLAASYVGWTRQQSRNHYTRDVLGGAAIGLLSNHDLSEFRTLFGRAGLGLGLLQADPGFRPAANEAEDPAAPVFARGVRGESPLVPAMRFHLEF
jgi:membrane-associated phospholipid phosphatase